MKRIVVIQYKRLETLHPVMTLLLSLKKIGCAVYFVGVASEPAVSFLTKNAIPYYFIPFKEKLYHNDNLYQKITHRVERALRFFECRRSAVHAVEKICKECNDVILWFICVQSAALFGNAFQRYRKRIISIYELGEDYGRAWIGFDFKKFMRSSTVVVPEYNRACITKELYALQKQPLVVVNRPFQCTIPNGYDLPKDIQKVFVSIGNKPIFLYQGVWTDDRKDVVKVLSTIARFRPNYAVVVIPVSEAARKELAEYENAFLLPYIAPPNHLAVTVRATIGIAIYTPTGSSLLGRLNPAYCAPNKIYEYAGFGIPTLGNNIPGLKYSIEANGAGLCCELIESEILKTADRLVENIEKYREGARHFFDNSDVVSEISKVVDNVEVER